MFNILRKNYVGLTQGYRHRMGSLMINDHNPEVKWQEPACSPIAGPPSNLSFSICIVEKSSASHFSNILPPGIFPQSTCSSPSWLLNLSNVSGWRWRLKVELIKHQQVVMRAHKSKSELNLFSETRATLLFNNSTMIMFPKL